MIRRVTTVVVSVLGLSILILAVGAIAGAVRQPDTPAATESTARQQLADPDTTLATADARYRDSLGHAAARGHG